MKLRIWPHLLKKSLIENFIFCAYIVMLVIMPMEYNTFTNLVTFTEEMLNEKLHFLCNVIMWQVLQTSTQR